MDRRFSRRDGNGRGQRMPKAEETVAFTFPQIVLPLPHLATFQPFRNSTSSVAEEFLQKARRFLAAAAKVMAFIGFCPPLFDPFVRRFPSKWSRFPHTFCPSKMPKSSLSFSHCRITMPALALLIPLSLIAVSNARVFTSMADLLDEQHHQQLHLPLWRSASGLAPSFSPFRSLPAAALSAEPTDDEAEETAEDSPISVPATASGEAKQKRRLVVRVPFAQNPDNLHLSRIYKSLFDASQQSRAKKYESEGYGLRRFVPLF
ncbi:hypothetical protein niasHT_016029 [Heterodera trifolii]|uniref:Transmembrane protein n=1 Tax=Heterodera trifolii TaxID=157864 RepID=A0ABD2LGD4_9BILA